MHIPFLFSADKGLVIEINLWVTRIFAAQLFNKSDLVVVGVRIGERELHPLLLHPKLEVEAQLNLI